MPFSVGSRHRPGGGVASATYLKDCHPELVESCPLGTGKIELPKAIPQGEGSRERTESTTSNYFVPFPSSHNHPGHAIGHELPSRGQAHAAIVLKGEAVCGEFLELSLIFKFSSCHALA